MGDVYGMDGTGDVYGTDGTGDVCGMGGTDGTSGVDAAADVDNDAEIISLKFLFCVLHRLIILSCEFTVFIFVLLFLERFVMLDLCDLLDLRDLLEVRAIVLVLFILSENGMTVNWHFILSQRINMIFCIFNALVIKAPSVSKDRYSELD